MSTPDFSSGARPRYHFTAPTNWLNDPNGLVYLDGIYHLFYQHNPEANTFGSPHWGHATSSDLVTWEHHPIALEPDGLGFIFSGSAVVDHANTAGFGAGAIVAVFTHHLDQGVERQSIAFSTDGGTSFEKYGGNPVLEPPDDTPDFRDPKVFWWDDGAGGGHWVMLLAVGVAIWIYTSPDLKRWEPASRFDPDPHSAQVWECPDLAKLRVDGAGDEHWVMTIGVDSGDHPQRYGTRYWIGDFDGYRFVESDRSVLWADWGPDFYAVQSWSNPPETRHLWIGWMSNWAYAGETPTLEWRGAMTVPREVGLAETVDGLRLTQRPVRELESRRRTLLRAAGLELAPGVNPLAGFRGTALDLLLHVDTAKSTADEVRLAVRCGPTESTDIVLDLRAMTVAVDRFDSGPHPMHRRYAGPCLASLPRERGGVDLRVLVDATSVELFAAGGLVSTTVQIFPDPESNALGLEVTGGRASIELLEVHTIGPSTERG